MVSVGLVLPSQVEGHHVRIAAVIYEPSLVTVEHRVDAKWEELVMEELLDRLLFVVVLAQIVQVKQVRQPVIIVVGAAHIALLLAHDLAQVLHEEGARGDFVDGDQAPHRYLLSGLLAEQPGRAQLLLVVKLLLISRPLGPRLRGLISLLEYWLLCLFDSADEKFESLLVLGGNEEV